MSGGDFLRGSKNERAMPGGRASSIPLLGKSAEPTIFELSSSTRTAHQFHACDIPEYPLETLIPSDHLANSTVEMPEVSERDLVAHFTRLSHRQFSVDLGAYPLGSCTMKYNPKVCDAVADMPGISNVHPGSPASLCQGWLEILVELEEALCEITGMAAATLQPAAGAAGELTGLLLMRAFHESKGRNPRRVIIPDSAHGTNPASVSLAGYEVTTVGSDQRGCVNVRELREVLDSDVAGIMLTNPNTLGLFEDDIAEIARALHEVDALLYYDGANLNAILGITRPGDMGFDIVHMNLHKTFATPHGGGGPGAGPVAVSQRLVSFLPGPRPVRNQSHNDRADNDPDRFIWEMPENTVGRIHSWHGNALVLARALTYILIHGSDGMLKVAQRAVLNANWLRVRLNHTYDVPYDRACMHEVVLSVNSLKKRYGLTALEVAKRLLDEGFHSPTVYFPLIVNEALMIEPTETESLQTLESLAEALERVASMAELGGEVGAAPRNTPVKRVDEVKAARKLVATLDARQ